jgi:alpha-tubulin suppressor-like RCC1 family protein
MGGAGAPGPDGGQGDGAISDGPPAVAVVVRNVLALGEIHSCALTAAGAVHCWGQNNASQLGNAGAGTGSNVPVASASGMVFAALAAGQNHTCGLTAAGKAYCWGYGAEIGFGNGATTAVPGAVAGDLAFNQLSAGRLYTCGVAADGTGYCWGSNGSGELGNDTNPAFPARMPTKVAGALTFKTINAGVGDHTCGVTTAGDAYCWGDNSSGQLGNEMMGAAVRMPVAVKGGVKFQVAVPGDNFSCGLGMDAKIYCWGDNGAGAQGNGQPANVETQVPAPIASTETFKALAAGKSFACGLSTGGTVLCWGSTRNGQTGRGDHTQNLPPTQLAGTPTPVMGGHTFAAVAAGIEHACAITTQGAAYCWGFNSRGEVGDGTVMLRAVPTAVTGGLTFATQ